MFVALRGSKTPSEEGPTGQLVNMTQCHLEKSQMLLVGCIMRKHLVTSSVNPEAL